MDGYKFWETVDQLRPEGDLKTFVKNNGLDYVRITNQRSDCRIPKLEDAYAIAKALDVSIEHLITGTDDLGPFNEFIPYLKKASEGDLTSIRKILGMPEKKVAGSSGMEAS